MPEIRKSYQNLIIVLKLIKNLRVQPMTREDIQNFLSQEKNIAKGIPLNRGEKVCKRTIKRTLDFIKDLYDDQLEFEETNGTYTLNLYDFPDTIDELEIQALDIALHKMGNNKNAQNLLKSLKSKLTARLYRKIKQTNPKKAIRNINDVEQKIHSDYVFVGPRLTIDFDEDVKSKLESAINKQYEVIFKYKNQEHRVFPLGIMVSQNNVYLVAYKGQITKNSVPQHYILSNISDIKETQNWFKKDNNFSIENYANSMFGTYNDGKVYDVEWLIKKPEIIKIAQKYKFHPTQQFIDNPDGSLTIKMRTGGLQAISSFLATWNGDIIPKKPKELIKNYKELLQNCLNSIE